MNETPPLAPQTLLTLEEESVAIQLNSRIRRGDMRAVQVLAELRQRVARRSLAVAAPKSLAEIMDMQIRLLEAVASGVVSPAEAAHISVVLENHGKAIERADIESRVASMEVALREQKERPA